MKGLRILLVGFVFLIQSVLGPHVQLCFSSCLRRGPANCESSYASASLGHNILQPTIFGNGTTAQVGNKKPQTWTSTIKPVINTLTNKALFGWFWVEASGTPTIEIFSIQAESQESKTNGVGSFLYPTDGQSSSCVPSGEANSILPCFMVKSPYHLTSTGFGNSGSYSNIKALHRLDFPPCPLFGEKSNFRYRIYVLQNDNELLIRAGGPIVNVKNYVSGAADPEPPKGNIKCGGSEPFGGWIHSTSNDNSDYSLGVAGCGVGLQKGWSSSKLLFYGRCPEGSRKDLKPGVTPKYVCNEGNSFYRGLRDHHEYIKTEMRDSVCNSCRHIWDNSGTIGHSCDSKIGREIFGLRKGHGILMTIFTMFLLPVSIFVSRYFKETFMSTKVVHLPVWYAIHVHISIAKLGILSGGLISAVFARSFFGLSTYPTSIIHDAMGWIAVLLFLLTFLSSSFRCKVQKARMLSICLHFVFGILVYVLCLLGMATSCAIPGSPATRSEVAHTENPQAIWIEPVVEPGVLVPVFVRIVVDIVFCVIMSLNLKGADRAMGLGGKRKYAAFCVPIPLYDLTSKIDIPGGKIRKILLGVYTALSLVLTLGICVVILTTPSTDRFFGPMRYTHKPNGKLFAVNRIQSYQL